MILLSANLSNALAMTSLFRKPRIMRGKVLWHINRTRAHRFQSLKR